MIKLFLSDEALWLFLERRHVQSLKSSRALSCRPFGASVYEDALREQTSTCSETDCKRQQRF